MSDSFHRPLRRALVSVYDKTGLAELAQGLHAAGVELVSTGSTAARIEAAGVPVTPVEKVTGFAECLQGRVKTLHPHIHAGILADLRKPEHEAQLAGLSIKPFDLVVGNLYPFSETVASGAEFDDCIEQIDIGGPSMVRAAAKNHPSVAVVVNPEHYAKVVAAASGEGFTQKERRQLAAEAFAHTAAYDVAVSTWFAQQIAEEDSQDIEDADTAGSETTLPEVTGALWHREKVLRYGENPHQPAALYRDGDAIGIASAVQLHGKEMSFNNYVDGDAALRAAFDQQGAAVAVIKHANPCGIAVGSDIAEAHRKAHACDPVSAFGGVIAANQKVTAQMASQVAEVFTEVVLAPEFEPEALEILTKKKNIRLLTVERPERGRFEQRPISGGVLVQAVDTLQAEGDDPANWTLAAGEAADEATLQDLAFAWRSCRAVKSNAILLADDGASVGVGMGQVNRVDSCRLAVERAGQERAKDAVAASDAFFPFADGLQVLLDAGVRAVVQPGGSVRDQEVIDAAQEAGITMYFTGARHFAH